MQRGYDERGDALQGDEINLSELKRNSYEEVVFENAARMHLDHDLAIELTAGGRLRTMPLDLRLLDTTHWPTVLEIHPDREIITIDTWTATASSLIEIKAGARPRRNIRLEITDRPHGRRWAHELQGFAGRARFWCRRARMHRHPVLCRGRVSPRPVRSRIGSQPIRRAFARSPAFLGRETKTVPIGEQSGMPGSLPQCMVQNTGS
jgi:hypothetical protein